LCVEGALHDLRAAAAVDDEYEFIQEAREIGVGNPCRRVREEERETGVGGSGVVGEGELLESGETSAVETASFETGDGVYPPR
jgi:hypothetical protein